MKDLTKKLQTAAKALDPAAEQAKATEILTKIHVGGKLSDEELLFGYWFFFNAYQTARALGPTYRLFRNEALREFDRLEGFAVARGLIQR